jgi:chromosome segregation protein
VQFLKLRLSGFKSFVDPTELVIEPGATGIVGPNGCGKSNLVEALRWVMGESSARRMRGAEMDDVIFGGTTSRPARNVADVLLTLDNTGRTAPAPFNDHDQLEILRRIERGRGTDYRVNGRPARLRDMQLLFADNNSGANSPALVSQGRVGALIGAKPGERRLLLEEAAGIAGLHARRHDAELRLKAAEANLQRLDDVLGALDQQLAGLRRQARQAQRYRQLSESVRAVEAELLHFRWQQADAVRQSAEAALAAAESHLRDAMVQAVSAGTAQANAAAALPDARGAEAAAALQRLLIARQRLEDEARQVQRQRQELADRRAQILGDIARERQLADEAVQALGDLAEEHLTVEAEQAGEADALDVAQARVDSLVELVEQRDADLAHHTELAAGTSARRAGLERQQREGQQRQGALTQQSVALDAELEALRAELARAGDPSAAESDVALAQARLEHAQDGAEAAMFRRQAVEAEAAQAREALQKAEAERGKLAAERSALRDLTRDGAARTGGAPMLDALTVDSGFEAALAAALGEALSASTDAGQPSYWRDLPPLDPPSWPAGAVPLLRRVQAPAALARSLAWVGLVENGDEGSRLQSALSVGQVLVSAAGDLWRWDGFVRLAGAPSANATRLRQRNRLAVLEQRLEVAEVSVAMARELAGAARALVDSAAEAERAGRDAVRAATAAVSAARDTLSAVIRRTATTASRLEAGRERTRRLQADLHEAAEALQKTALSLANLPDDTEMRATVAAARTALSEARSQHTAELATLDRLRHAAQARAARLHALVHEMAVWRERSEGATHRVVALVARAEAVADDLAELEARPDALAEQSAQLDDAIAEAELRRRRAADALAQAETRLHGADQLARAAERAVGDAREARALREGADVAARQALAVLAERIAERLDCTPTQLPALTGWDGATPVSASDLEGRLERLHREREAMGAVNLRAEQEVAELEARLGTMIAERDDLIAAIARLRQGIASLNDEARTRLRASFDIVDGHFQRLFGRLFGGGRAHLRMTDADDPLEAGLEIYASPPGKKLQVLSLLSGGEQALTAMALIFAVFMTRPAPVCVLDEVDAPLDDANVERFCLLVDDIGRETGTRFLVITHHRLTMARMDRLFGVTMAERGVSQLVSVNLAAVADLRAAE